MGTRARRKTGTVPHTILIYSDLRDRRRLIDSCLSGAITGLHDLVILTSEPKIDSKMFGGRPGKKGRSALDRLPRSMIDVRHILADDHKAPDRLSSLIRELNRKAMKENTRSLIFANYPFEFYQDLSRELAIEESVGDMRDLVCCYKGEGFWSLDPAQIARELELHQRILFGSTRLEKTGSAMPT